jgi:membrane associated rhomboid family serine protease
MSYDGMRFALPGLSPAVRLLLVVNVAVFALNALLLGRLSDPAPGGGAWLAFSWSGLFDGHGLGLLRLVSYQFTHAFVDPLHLLMNLLVLWMFGAMVEPRLGYRGTLQLYLAGGIGGAVLHVAVAALQGMANVPLVGASGACYAFLVHAACCAPRQPVLLLLVQVPLWGLAALLVGLGLYSTFVELATGYPGGVSHGAHLGGALVGGLVQRLGWWQDHGAAERSAGGLAGVGERLRRWRQQQKAQQQQRAEQQLDAILAKVQAQGLAALTPAERRCLQQASAARRR